MRPVLLLLLVACGTPAHLQGNGCSKPQVWYPDVDLDGIGETTSSYFGCKPPAGWVNTLTGETTGGTGTGNMSLTDTGQAAN